MSEERKTKTDAAAPASAALERIDRKDAFLQALHTFLTAHQGTEWAVAAVDIQHFKLYNELYGTEKGDVLLETMANCLLGYSKQTGYPVGYFGNDDFFLCLPDEKAEQTAVLATLQACMAAGRQDVTFFVVMGVCPVQANPGADAATLCNYAQIAGVTTDSGYLHRFEPTMLNELKEQQQLLGELERALDNHEFCFFLQPKCNSITRAIVGMEALVRWNHPTRGCVPPAEFMPLLERTGLVTRLDQYIWESVCQTLQKWQESGSNLVPVSVNVSVQDILNLDVPQIFADLVEKYKLEPKLLLAEITETMVAEDTQMVESAIQGLHRKGFAVMMDDFGSGYSSLNALKDVAVDLIKLDMKFLDAKDTSGKGGSILNCIVRMTRWLGLEVLAEGVETKEQAEYLKNIGCDFMQGYYFSRPIPADEFEQKLISSRTESSENLSNNGITDVAELMDSVMSNPLFFNLMGAAAIAESDGSNLEALMINDSFFEMIGCTREEYQPYFRHMDMYNKLVGDRNEAVESFRHSIRNKLPHDFCITADDGSVRSIRMFCRRLFSDGEKDILLLLFDDITDQSDIQ